MNIAVSQPENTGDRGLLVWHVICPDACSMKHSIEFQGLAPGSETEETIRRLIEEGTAHLEKHARALKQDVISLRVVVQKNKLYHVAAHLAVPGNVLAAANEGHDIEASVRDVFANLLRQLEEYKQRVRGEHLWKQMRKREELRRRKLSVSPPPAF